MTPPDYSKKRNAEIIKPKNLLKTKVGSGGLDQNMLTRAENLITKNNTDFKPLAENFLSSMSDTLGVIIAAQDKHLPQDEQEQETVINSLLYPALELKSHGAMFHYPFISKVAASLVRFLEIISVPDDKSIAIVQAHMNAITLVLTGQLNKEDSPQGDLLLKELQEVCQRYYKQYLN